MKKHVLFISAFLAMFICNGQFTLEDFPREANLTDTFFLSSVIFPSIEHGSGVTWDFSAAQIEEERTRPYLEAEDPFFADAYNYRSRPLNFQGFVIESNEYEALDENGYRAIGRSVEEVTFPISLITGGENDVLTFLGGNYLYNAPERFLEFPANYNDAWVSTFDEVIDFELSVASFGLNATPGQQIRSNVFSREIVGEGFFIIPDEEGQPSDPIEGFLIHVSETRTDSVFLGGAPGPAPLMQAFGLTQGNTFTLEYYVAYAYGLDTPLLGMNLENGEPINFVYRPQAAFLGDPANAVQERSDARFKAFPNPVEAGEYIQIQGKSNEQISAVQLFGINGEMIQELETLTQELHSGLRVAVPNTLSSGMYFVQLLNANGELIARSKFVVK
ncbi:MAG: T9SS type A sorting domain-containing protein [Flavobacteriales bacterium]|nr:T9SS type A sorting domain-containing protein [Flavobacteriales bacterium]MDP4954374.1 T9SS type A sorting domain-containing protein [Flavobacteriales bacterium]